MKKYRVGDKVKLRFSQSDPAFKSGNIVTIVKILHNEVFDYEIKKDIGNSYIIICVSESDVVDKE